jgi:hypothetical protein
MSLAMPKSVHITTPPLNFEEEVRRLRIPKARQKQLREMMDEARARLAAEQQEHASPVVQRKELPQNAHAAS